MRKPNRNHGNRLSLRWLFAIATAVSIQLFLVDNVGHDRLATTVAVEHKQHDSPAATYVATGERILGYTVQLIELFRTIK